MITNELIKSGQIYPEISRKNGRIVTESVKDYLYKNNLISESDYIDPNCDYGIIARGIFAAAADDCGIPENLSSVLSMSRVNKFNHNDGKYFPWYFDHKFIVVDNEEIKTNILVDPRAYSCKCGPRSCITCQKCYKKDPDYITAVEMLRK